MSAVENESEAEGGLDARHLLALRAFPPLSRLAMNDLVALSQIFVAERVPRRTVLARPGEELAAVYFVLEGEVSVALGSHRENVTQGAIGFMALVAGPPHRLHAVTRTDVSALVADAEAVMDLLEDNFGVLRDILSTFAGQVLERAAEQQTVWLPPAGSEEPPATSAEPTAGERMVFLARHGWVARGRLEAIAELASVATVIRHPAGERLWQRGDPAETVWMLLEGAVELRTEAGATATAGPGRELGTIEALAAVPHGTEAVVTADLRALAIPVDAILDLIEDQSEVGLDLAAKLASEIQGVPAPEPAPAPAPKKRRFLKVRK